MHNALRQVHLDLKPYSLKGFSISGLATYIQIPELDSLFDIGECPLSAVPLNHVFLSHAHGDHARCLMRHFSLRKMLGIERAPSYYLADYLVEPAKNWIHAEALFEGIPEDRILYPNFIGLKTNGDRTFLTHRKDLCVKAFSVRHSLPSIGFTVEAFKKKLKKEYLHLKGQEIAELRQSGVEITNEVYAPIITFIGDCVGKSLFENEEIWESEILVLECTFIAPDEEKMASNKGHTHLNEIIAALEQFGDKVKSKHIVLKHFSMKYTREYVFKTIDQQMPEQWKSRIKILA